MMTKKILLVGCGRWGKNILRDLKKLNCYVVVLCFSDRDRNNAKDLADEMISNISQIGVIDGVVIATLAYSHAKTVHLLAHLSVPFFVEKPLATCVHEARQLVKDFPDCLFVMHKWLYHNGVLLLGDIIKKQEFGRVIGINTKRMVNFLPHPDSDVVWTLVPHELSILLGLLGYLPKVDKVVATEWHNEAVSMIIHYVGNPWILQEVSSIATQKLSIIHVECEDAALTLNDGLTDTIQIYHRQSRKLGLHNHVDHCEKRVFDNEMPLFLELKEFINYLNGGPKPKSDVNEGLKIVEMVAHLRALANLKHNGILMEPPEKKLASIL